MFSSLKKVPAAFKTRFNPYAKSQQPKKTRQRRKTAADFLDLEPDTYDMAAVIASLEADLGAQDEVAHQASTVLNTKSSEDAQQEPEPSANDDELPSYEEVEQAEKAAKEAEEVDRFLAAGFGSIALRPEGEDFADMLIKEAQKDVDEKKKALDAKKKELELQKLLRNYKNGHLEGEEPQRRERDTSNLSAGARLIQALARRPGSPRRRRVVVPVPAQQEAPQPTTSTEPSSSTPQVPSAATPSDDTKSATPSSTVSQAVTPPISEHHQNEKSQSSVPKHPFEIAVPSAQSSARDSPLLHDPVQPTLQHFPSVPICAAQPIQPVDLGIPIQHTLSDPSLPLPQAANASSDITTFDPSFAQTAQIILNVSPPSATINSSSTDFNSAALSTQNNATLHASTSLQISDISTTTASLALPLLQVQNDNYLHAPASTHVSDYPTNHVYAAVSSQRQPSYHLIQNGDSVNLYSQPQNPTIPPDYHIHSAPPPYQPEASPAPSAVPLQYVHPDAYSISQPPVCEPAPPVPSYTILQALYPVQSDATPQQPVIGATEDYVGQHSNGLEREDESMEQREEPNFDTEEPMEFSASASPVDADPLQAPTAPFPPPGLDVPFVIMSIPPEAGSSMHNSLSALPPETPLMPSSAAVPPKTPLIPSSSAAPSVPSSTDILATPPVSSQVTYTTSVSDSESLDARTGYLDLLASVALGDIAVSSDDTVDLETLGASKCAKTAEEVAPVVVEETGPADLPRYGAGDLDTLGTSECAKSPEDIASVATEESGPFSSANATEKRASTSWPLRSGRSTPRAWRSHRLGLSPPATRHIKTTVRETKIIRSCTFVQPYLGVSHTQTRLLRAAKGRMQKDLRGMKLLEGIEGFVAWCGGCSKPAAKRRKYAKDFVSVEETSIPNPLPWPLRSSVPLRPSLTFQRIVPPVCTVPETTVSAVGAAPTSWAPHPPRSTPPSSPRSRRHMALREKSVDQDDNRSGLSSQATCHLTTTVQEMKVVRNCTFAQPYKGVSRTQARLLRADRGRSSHRDLSGTKLVRGIEAFVASCSGSSKHPPSKRRRDAECDEAEVPPPKKSRVVRYEDEEEPKRSSRSKHISRRRRRFPMEDEFLLSIPGALLLEEDSMEVQSSDRQVPYQRQHGSDQDQCEQPASTFFGVVKNVFCSLWSCC